MTEMQRILGYIARVKKVLENLGFLMMDKGEKPGS